MGSLGIDKLFLLLLCGMTWVAGNCCVTHDMCQFIGVMKVLDWIFEWKVLAFTVAWSIPSGKIFGLL